MVGPHISIIPGNIVNLQPINIYGNSSSIDKPKNPILFILKPWMTYVDHFHASLSIFLDAKYLVLYEAKTRAASTIVIK